IVVLLAGWPWRQPRAGRLSAGSALGVGLGIALGVGALGGLPHYPPREDQDFLLLILMPAAPPGELLAAALNRWHWAAWLPRLAVAAAAAPILLHSTVYLKAFPPDPPRWSRHEAWMILGGLALAFAVEWFLLERLSRREAHRGVT